MPAIIVCRRDDKKLKIVELNKPCRFNLLTMNLSFDNIDKLIDGIKPSSIHKSRFNAIGLSLNLAFIFRIMSCIMKL